MAPKLNRPNLSKTLTSIPYPFSSFNVLLMALCYEGNKKLDEQQKVHIQNLYTQQGNLVQAVSYLLSLQDIKDDDLVQGLKSAKIEYEFIDDNDPLIQVRNLSAHALYILGIICTRDHELESFKRLVNERQQTWKLIHEANPAEPYTRFSVSTYQVALQRQKNQYLLVHVGCFGKQQGPVISAAYTSQFLALHPKVKWVCMIGIAGGRKLGDVCIAHEAFAPLQGKVRKLTSDAAAEYMCAHPAHPIGNDDTGYYYTFKGKADQAQSYVSRETNVMHQAIDTFSKVIGEHSDERKEVPENQRSYRVFLAPMLSYSQVRNDCELEFRRLERVCYQDVPEKDRALDMEAYAFFKVLAVFNKPGIVIKGISDIGAELEQGDASVDRDAVRKAFRHHASHRAAVVMMKYIDDVFDQPKTTTSIQHVLS